MGINSSVTLFMYIHDKLSTGKWFDASLYSSIGQDNHSEANRNSFQSLDFSGTSTKEPQSSSSKQNVIKRYMLEEKVVKAENDQHLLNIGFIDKNPEQKLLSFRNSCKPYYVGFFFFFLNARAFL